MLVRGKQHGSLWISEELDHSVARGLRGGQLYLPTEEERVLHALVLSTRLAAAGHPVSAP